MFHRKYFAEFLGTFALTLLVLVSLNVSLPLSTPMIAAITVGLFAYALGSVSGAHFNPAVTIAMFSIQKISLRDGLIYILAQFIGAVAAMGLVSALMESNAMLTVEQSFIIGVAEAIGAAFLLFAVTTVTIKKVSAEVSGLLIGGCLLLGILVASPFSNGILNPAVALGLGSFGLCYIIGPIVGGIAGAYIACFLHGERVKFGK